MYLIITLSIITMIALFILVLAILYNNKYNIFLNWIVKKDTVYNTRSKFNINRKFKAFYIAFNEQRYNANLHVFNLYVNLYFFGFHYSTELHKQ